MLRNGKPRPIHKPATDQVLVFIDACYERSGTGVVEREECVLILLAIAGSTFPWKSTMVCWNAWGKITKPSYCNFRGRNYRCRSWNVALVPCIQRKIGPFV